MTHTHTNTHTHTHTHTHTPHTMSGTARDGCERFDGRYKFSKVLYILVFCILYWRYKFSHVIYILGFLCSKCTRALTLRITQLTSPRRWLAAPSAKLLLATILRPTESSCRRSVFFGFF